MATAAQMRKLALSMPEAEEKSHFEQADFRVRNKIFAGLSKDEKQGTLKLTPELQTMLVTDGASPFTPAAGAWGRSGWTHIDLAGVEIGVLEEMVAEAWRLVAPRSLVSPRSGAVVKPTKPRAARSKAGANAKRPRARGAK